MQDEAVLILERHSREQPFVEILGGSNDMGDCKCVDIYFKQSVCCIINSIKNGIVFRVDCFDICVVFSISFLQPNSVDRSKI